MKKLLIIFCCVAVCQVEAAQYSLGSKLRPAFAEVVSENSKLNISCTFKPVDKFSPDRNAEINRLRADNYCQKALLLYLKAAAGETVDLSGIAIAGAPVYHNSMVTYRFVGHKPVRNLTESATDKKDKMNSPTDLTVTRQNKTSLTVIRYQKKNHHVEVVSSKEYRPDSFKNQTEFDAFCKKQFDEIDRIAEANRQNILKSFRQNRNKLINSQHTEK